MQPHTLLQPARIPPEPTQAPLQPRLAPCRQTFSANSAANRRRTKPLPQAVVEAEGVAEAVAGPRPKLPRMKPPRLL